MNFLAHLALSGNNDKIKTGNFIGDWVKGSIEKHTHFPDKILQGIAMHRQIDSYTDSHPVYKLSAAKFKPAFGRYAGIITDVVYDHFLAVQWNKFSNQSLNAFSKNCYLAFLANFIYLPADVKMFLPFMIAGNRLTSYAKLEGIRKALDIMVRHSSLTHGGSVALPVIQDNYEELTQEFNQFFAEIKHFMEEKYNIQILHYL